MTRWNVHTTILGSYFHMHNPDGSTREWLRLYNKEIAASIYDIPGMFRVRRSKRSNGKTVTRMYAHISVVRAIELYVSANGFAGISVYEFVRRMLMGGAQCNSIQ